jgi:hypothetical protein
MVPTRRFIFRGNAAAFGGRIVRPKDITLEAGGASVLTVAGGRSTWSGRDLQFGDTVRIKSAMTFAEGVFDDTKKLVDLTNHKVAEETLATTTVVKAAVKGLVVGSKPQLKVKSVQASMTSKSPTASYEPTIRLDNETSFDGVSIDGHELEVEIAHDVFQRFDTRAKLLAAADDPKFVKQHGHHFYLMGQPERRRLVREGGYLIATVVKRISWKGSPMAGARIDDNSVVVPEFGTIHFGEILITAAERRLSMLRLQLGSPEGGSEVYVDVGSNGTWSI